MLKVIRKEDGRYYKPCSKCNVEQSYARKQYAELSLAQKKLCKSCSNKLPQNNQHKGWIKDVLRLSFIKKYEAHAKLKKREWSVSFEYLADLLIKQDFKCSLTGWDIDAMNVQNNTASLDRIDSSVGYIEGNVQWVHKMVNMCKQNYEQIEFIEMCEAITEHKLNK